VRRAEGAVEPGEERTAPRVGPCGVLCEDCRVRTISVCRALAGPALDELKAITLRVRLPAGRHLFDEGDPAESLFTLTEGMIKLFKMLPDGRRQITGFLLPGDFLGLAFFRSYAYSAEAVTDALLCRFPRDRFMALLERHPALEKELLSRARRQSAGGRKPVALPMSRWDIADYLGLTVETVSREIQAAKASGAIAMPDRHHFLVVDAQRLAAAAALG